MNRPTMLLSWILRNAGILASVAVERDVLEIERRYEHEGLSFLTITLPVLCDALDQGLARGRIAVSDFLGFKPASRNGSLPALLQGFFIRVFNNDGSLVAQPCIDSIFAIRQVARAFKKLEHACTNTRNVRAFERYVTNDESLNGTCSWTGDVALLHVVSGYLWSDLERLSRELYCSPGIFGGGACAERRGFNARHSVIQWPERAESCFPMAYHTSHDEGDVETFSGIEVIPVEREHPVRVVGVPKTLKTPRIISIEPSYMMLMQQSIMWPLVGWLESGRLGFKSIRFTDQTVNRDLARLGSLDGKLSTIDLSDASDRVSNDLVSFIFRNSPTFLEYIQACRSRNAKMPDGRLISLRKFASMGSALCFPIEAMVFLTVAVAGILATSGMRPSRRSINSITAKLAIYGDDIIVPTPMAAGVMEYLEAFELRVNHSKSFTQGYFRESCGGDYYKGVDVTPAYVRRFDFSGKRLRGQNMAAYVSLSNQLYMKGLWHASQQIRDLIERTLRRTLSRTQKPQGVLTWTSVLYDTNLRWDSELCCWRVGGLRTSVSFNEDCCQDLPGHMLRAFSAQFKSRARTEHGYVRTRDSSISTEWEFPYLRRAECDIDDRRANQTDYYDYLRSEADNCKTPDSRRKRLDENLAAWELELRSYSKPDWFEHLRGLSTSTDFNASVRPHSLNTNYGWCPTSTVGCWGL